MGAPVWNALGVTMAVLLTSSSANFTSDISDATMTTTFTETLPLVNVSLEEDKKYEHWWNHSYEVHHFEEVTIVALVAITLMVDMIQHKLESCTAHSGIVPREEEDEEEEELENHMPLRHVLWTRATAEFTVLGILAFIVWICYRSGVFEALYELCEDVDDIALPLTPQQYHHSVENVHMHLFITFILYFMVMAGSIVVAENTMKKWATKSHSFRLERRAAIGKEASHFTAEDWIREFVTIRQTFLDYLPRQVANSEYFNAQLSGVLKKYDIKLREESIPMFMAPWFPFTHYILANYRDLLEHMVQINVIALSAVAVIQGGQALVHRLKADFDFSFIWIGLVAVIAIGLYFYTRKFHVELKTGKHLQGHLSDYWARSCKHCYYLCSVLQICLLVTCFELTRPVAHGWPWVLDWWRSMSHVFTAVVIMPCAGLLLGHLLAQMAIAISVGGMNKRNAKRMANIVDRHLRCESFGPFREQKDGKLSL